MIDYNSLGGLIIMTVIATLNLGFFLLRIVLEKTVKPLGLLNLGVGLLAAWVVVLIYAQIS